MRVIFQQNKTGLMPLYPYSIHSIRGTDRCQTALDSILQQIGFSVSDIEIKNTCNMFNTQHSDLYCLIAHQLGENDRLMHAEGYNTDVGELRLFFNCYQPHLIMGDDLGFLSQIPDVVFYNLTHIVVKNITPELWGFAKSHNIKVFILEIEFTEAEWIININEYVE